MMLNVSNFFTGIQSHYGIDVIHILLLEIQKINFFNDISVYITPSVCQIII